MSERDLQRARPPVDVRSLTPARIALERTGASLTTRHALEFALAHAQARDAVHSALSVPSLLASLRERGLASIAVKSAANGRTEYLRRPDLGRRLSESSTALLAAAPPASSERGATLSVIVADGLSALATDRHALPVLDALLPLLVGGLNGGAWQLAPVVVAEQARVALGDPIGALLHADATVVLIGERPGLSSHDSLGAYITWHPRPGRTDAERNCVSNIRPQLAGQAGLDYDTAARKIAWYLNEGRRLGLTGVHIREADGVATGADRSAALAESGSSPPQADPDVSV